MNPHTWTRLYINGVELPGDATACTSDAEPPPVHAPVTMTATGTYEMPAEAFADLLGHTAAAQYHVAINGRTIGTVIDSALVDDNLRLTVEPTPAMRADMLIVDMGDAASSVAARYALVDLAWLFSLAMDGAA